MPSPFKPLRPMEGETARAVWPRPHELVREQSGYGLSWETRRSRALLPSGRQSPLSLGRSTLSERGGLTLEQVAARMNLTRERARQIERHALATLPDESLIALQEARRAR